MKNTNTNAYKATVFAYLAASTYDFDETGKPDTEENRAQHIRDRFEGEFNHDYNKRAFPNNQARVADWLAGLPLSIDYTNHQIIQTVQDWHGCTLTDKQCETVVSNWWSHLAFKLIQLFAKHDIAPVS